MLVLYVATLPLLRFELFKVGSKSVVPCDVAFGALVMGALLAGGWRRPTRGLLLSASLPLAGVVMATLATNTALTIAGPEIFRTAYSMTTLVVFASLAISEQRVRRTVESWVLTAGLVCVVGLLAFAAVVGAGLPQNPLARADSTNIGFVRVASVLGPNALSLYLVIGVALAAFLTTRTEGFRPKWPASAMFLMALTVLLSFSRGLLGFAFTLSLLAFRKELAPCLLYRMRWALAPMTCALLVGGVIVTRWVHPLQTRAEQQSMSGGTLEMRPSAYTVLHAAGLRMLAARPVFGVGPGNFGAQLGSFTTPDERARSWPPLDLELNWSPHSTWIGLAADGGAVLLLSWVCLFVLLARRLVEARHPASLSAYVGLALAGTVVNGLHVDLIHLKFIWASLGLALNERR